MITKQTKFIGGIGATLFLVVLGLLIAAIYIITAKGEELQEQIAMLAEASEQKQSFNEIRRILDESAADRQALNELFLTEADTIDFLATIEQAARQQGLEITTDSLAVAEPENGPDTLNITFSVSGQETAVRNFISFLETLPYGSYLTSLDIEVSQEASTASARLGIAILLLPNYD